MVSSQASSPGRRPGAVAPLVALLLTVIVAVAAVAIDGGMAQDYRMRAQAAADNAALAAAIDLWQHYASNGGVDQYSTAFNSAISSASSNGFSSGNATVTVNLYPSKAQMSRLIGIGDQVPAGYAEVVIQYNQASYFGRFMGVTSIPVTAYAVARAQWRTVSDGIIVLNPTASGALNAHGNGEAYVKGASILVDSNDSYAVTSPGNGLVSDSGNGYVVITGSNPGYSGTIQGKLLTGQPPTPDPFAYLPAPDPSTMTSYSISQITSGNTTLQPGRYLGGISISSTANVTLTAGVYYMDGGSLSVTGNGTVVGNGVMIYSNTGIAIAGNGTVTLSPPTTGAYTGMALFEARTTTSGISIAGNGTFNVTGTIYCPDGQVGLVGNGDIGLGGQLVADTVDLGGNADLTINWGASPTARTRSIQLVE
jgi:hypothetical protein